MAEEKKDSSSESCRRKCDGCKFMCGIFVGLLLAGTAFGFYMAGRSGRSMCPLHKMCPLSDSGQSSK